jgi:hypothetical protein
MTLATGKLPVTMRSLTESELEAISGGGGSADKGTSETFSGSGSGTVSGTAAGPGADRHNAAVCSNTRLT